MKMNKKIKIIIFLIIMISVVFGSKYKVFADGEADTQKKSSWTDIFDLGEKFIKEGREKDFRDIDKDDADKVKTGDIDESQIKEDASNIFDIIFAIGVVLTVIVGGILGIKFMFAGIEDKAKIKEALVPYILGCIVIFGAVAIWKFIVSILDQM